MAKANTAAAGATYVLSILRIIAGALYLAHGLGHTFGLLGAHRANPASFLGIGGIIEVVGACFIILGLFTRLVAFVLCGQMAVAYFRVHAPHGLVPLQNGGELAILYCFLFLYLVFAGGGALSLDRIARGRA